MVGMGLSARTPDLETPAMRSASVYAPLAVLLASLTLPAQAGTPSSGTLTETSQPLEYSAGPFFAANPTPVPLTGEPPVCEDDGVSCDQFALTVTLPEDYDITNPEDVV